MAPTKLRAIHRRNHGTDEAWNTPVEMFIEPGVRLSPEQKTIIQTDYGMEDGELRIATRGALVQYVLQWYQADPDTVLANATAQQIQVRNLQRLKAWLY